MPFDLEFWRQKEGQTVDSVYPLERCVRVTPDGAIFDTLFHERPATMRISTDAARRREQWDQAAELSHPALDKILERGEETLGDQQVAYIVTERADDNLGEVLTDRPLTVDETLETLTPIISALRYLQRKGFANPNLTPASVLAFGDEIRISSDELAAYDETSASAQSRAIGALIEKMLGSGARPKDEPLAAIIKNTRKADVPWTLEQIHACLRGEAPVAPPPQPSPQREAAPPKGSDRIWMYAVAGVAVFALAAFLLRPAAEVQTPRPAATTTPEPQQQQEQQPQPQTQTQQPEAPPPVPPKEQPSARTEKPSPLGKAAAPREQPTTPEPQPQTTATEKPVTTMDGVTQVLPEIPAAARRTINGRVRINVRVQTDDAGRVTQATLLPPGASKYFTDRALAAARSWKFPPDSQVRNYTLRFELSRQQTTVSVSKP